MSMSDASNDSDFEPNSAPETTNESNKSGDDGARRDTLMRGLFMLLFGVLGYFALWATFFLALVQWIIVMINNDPNDDIKRFSANLAEYLAQIGRYLGFASDEKPCPFAPFPSVNDDK